MPEQVADPLAAFGQQRHLVGHAGHRPLDVLGCVGGEGDLEVLRYAVVVDDVSGVLAVRGAVHPGDGLQQFGFLDVPVQVHHLLGRCVEPGQQHRLDDQERDRAGVLRVRVTLDRQRLLEPGDDSVLLCLVRPLRPVRRIVLLRGDHRDEVECGDHIPERPGPHQPRRLAWQPVRLVGAAADLRPGSRASSSASSSSRAARNASRYRTAASREVATTCALNRWATRYPHSGAACSAPSPR